MQYIILDLEFNQAYRCPSNEIAKQEIIEIGAVKTDDNLNTVDVFQSYIQPNLYRKINPFVYEKTNITIEKLDAEGEPFPCVINRFIEWLGEEYILFSWGLDDIRELRNNCTYYNVNMDWLNQFIDLQRVYTQMQELPNRISLNKAVQNLEIDIESDFHSAINDAFYTLEIFKKIYDKDKFSSISFDNLQQQVILNNAQRKEFYETHKYTANCPRCGRFTKRLYKRMRNSSYLATHFCKHCDLKVRYKATPIKVNNQIVIKSKIKIINTEKSSD